MSQTEKKSEVKSCKLSKVWGKVISSNQDNVAMHLIEQIAEMNITSILDTNENYYKYKNFN